MKKLILINFLIILLITGCKKNSIELVEACEEGSLDEVIKLVESGVNVNSLNEDNWPVLLTVIDKEFYDIAEYLILNGADVNRSNSSLVYPIHKAVDKKNISLVELLLSYGADTDVCNNHTNDKFYTNPSVVHSSEVSSAKRELIESLQKGVYKTGSTPLELAAYLGYEDIALLLFPMIKREKNDMCYIMNFAAYNNMQKFLQKAFELDISLNLANYRGNQPWLYAYMNGHDELVVWLLEHGAELDINSHYGIEYVLNLIRQNNGEKNNVLFKYKLLGNEQHENYESFISIAADYGNLDVLKYLLDMVNELKFPNETELQLLLSAVWEDDSQFLEFLISKGIDINSYSMDGLGASAMFVASLFGAKKCVGVFKKHGAESFAKNINAVVEGETIITSCLQELLAGESKISIIQLEFLLKGGASPNLKNKKGISALDIAYKIGDPKIIKLLKRYGASE